MHLAVLIRAEEDRHLPTAAELRSAGFALSSALAPAGEDGAEPAEENSRGRENAPPDRAGPPRARTRERQGP